MEPALYHEMLASDCWDGKVVFSARGLKFDLLPNPAFGVFPCDISRHKAALFFTPHSVSLLVQKSVDDADIAVEDGLDTVSCIIEHHMPDSRERSSNSAAAVILEIRCLHNRVYFGVTPQCFDGVNYDPLQSPTTTGAAGSNPTSPAGVHKTFEALPSILHVYSPGLCYQRLAPVVSGASALAEAVEELGGSFLDTSLQQPLGEFGWSPPPPSESPPASTRRSAASPQSSSAAAAGGGGTTGKSRRSRASDGRGTDTAASNNSLQGSSAACSSSSSDNGKSSRGSSSASSSSGGYSSMMRRGKQSGRGAAARRLDLFGPAIGIGGGVSGAGGGSAGGGLLGQLQVSEAEDRCDVVLEQAAAFAEASATMQRSSEKICRALVEAVHAVHTTALGGKHSFACYDGEDGISLPIPASAREEPSSDAVKSFLGEMERAVRVRLGTYLAAGSGPQVLAQRQHAESAAMYRALTEQLERLKAQNSALAVQLAQERRHIEELENETERARHDAAQALARERAVISRMRNREAEFAKAAGAQMHVALHEDE